MRCLLLVAAAAAASTITPEQASKLRSLGYRASEIAAIRPSVASVVARRGLPRPKAGMPPSWVVDDADLAPVTRPRPLAGVVGLLQKLAFSVSMLARDLAAPRRRGPRREPGGPHSINDRRETVEQRGGLLPLRRAQ